MNRIIQKGERVVITHGEYSDYEILLIGEAVDSFDVDTAFKEFQVYCWQEQKNTDFYQAEYRFLAWLIAVKGAMQEVSVDWKEWHLPRHENGWKRTNDSYDSHDLGPWRDAHDFLQSSEVQWAMEEDKPKTPVFVAENNEYKTNGQS